MHGRKPKPTALKILNGNPGHRPLNHLEPKPRPGIPQPPAGLEPEEREIWLDAISVIPAGVLTVADGWALFRFAVAGARYLAARRMIQADGLTAETPQGIKKHPAVTVAEAAEKEMRAIGALLGMDPSSRCRLKTEPGKEPDAEIGAYFGEENSGARLQ